MSKLEGFNEVRLLSGDSFKLDRAHYSELSLKARFIKYPPTYKHHDGYPKPTRYSIDKFTNLRDQEAAIIQDLIYVLAGLEGYYIRYSEEFDINKASSRLSGPDFVINRHIDTSFKDITKRINKLGKMYFALCSFVEVYSDLVHGHIMQTLCYEIINFLKQYETLLRDIERHFKEDSKYSLTVLEQELSRGTTLDQIGVAVKIQRLYEIVESINRENEKRNGNSNLESLQFETMMRSLKDDHYTGTLDGVLSDSVNSRFVKGGMILNIIQMRIDGYKGNMRVHKFLIDIFDRVSMCYIEMLNKWLQYGIIDDNYDEFLISESSVSDNMKYDAMQWADKFTIRREGLLKQFQIREIQKKIILTGKYLNVLKECVGIKSLEDDYHNCTITSLQESDFQIRIDNAYNRANIYILKMFFERYHLDGWIKSLNKYFLFTEGSEYDDFLGNAYILLKKASDRVSLTSLTGYYRKSYLNTSGDLQLVHNLITPVLAKETFLNELTSILKAQTTDAEEVFATNNIESLRKLLISTMETNLQTHLTSPQTRIDNYCIQKFGVDIGVPFPLNLMISRSQVYEYQLLFREQSFLRFVDLSLLESWKEICHGGVWRWKFADPMLKRWIFRCRLLHRKMSDFIRMLYRYLTFNVVAVNWHTVEEIFSHMGKDDNINLETVYTTIKSFLSTVLDDSMLTKVKLTEVITELFSLILLFHNLIMSFKKTLVLMDRSLFDEKYDLLAAPVPEFDEVKNGERFDKMSSTLDSYSNAFKVKLKEFTVLLKYYGELDSTSLLVLYRELVRTYKD
ncbi:hypothetical protein FOA43_000672 [Brettanomyces nanus]|uniref:Spindle pole body component n=1 Tax=Eeniella nana TaxID=13502 RepID=A0A875RZP8_EENNA|nr:uncharacterized protein FOA43_000672 [Brettanomyces nanus]QPG73362.1 hypothetical protein FOA43_000672 [Brettanomyces nanus]